MEKLERAWFAFVANRDDLAEALSYAKGFLEEAHLSHHKVCLEIWVERKLPQSVEIREAAGMTS